MSNPSKPKRVGLIGAGYIAAWHADAIQSVSSVELASVCDVSASAAKSFGKIYGIPAFTSLDDMIEAKTCDAVHILTPPPLHKPLAIEAFKAGLDVLIEKPVALSVSETKSIQKAAEKAGKNFGASHNFLGIPSYQRLKRLIAEGRLGKVGSAEINWHFPLAPLRSGPFGLWMLDQPKNLLLELGPHLFAFVVDLFGTPDIEYVSVGKPVLTPDNGSRDQSFRILACADGVDININISLVEIMDDRSVTLRGSGGMARLDYANDTLIISRENTSDIVLNPLRRQLDQSAQHLKEGLVNAVRQAVSLNRNGPYALGFQGVVVGFHHPSQIDERFSATTALTVMEAIEDCIAQLPKFRKPLFKTSRKPKPSVLVIGGTGFIGRQLTRSLVASGRDVRVLSRGRNAPFKDLPDQVEVFSTALNDPIGLKSAMDGIKTVYHLAKTTDETWEDCLKNDVGSTLAIANAALESGVGHFIYTGTIASYDMSDPAKMISEETGFARDMQDRNLYARSKAECEKRLMTLHKEKGLPLVIARPGIVIGAGGPLQHWGIGRWHGAGAVRIWGQGRNILPFVLIDDVADGLIRMSENEQAIGESFNLVGEPMMSARDYFDAIHQSTGAKIDVTSGPFLGYFANDAVKYALKKYVLRRPNLTRASLSDWKSRAHYSPFDNNKPKALLGWQPETKREDFIRRAITEAGLFGF